MSPAEVAAEFHQLRELAPAFGVRTLRQIERAAKEAMERDDAETRALAETVAQGSPQDPLRINDRLPCTGTGAATR